MEKTNIERLQSIAEGLQTLNEQVVYVGGSVAGLYATDSAAAAPRPTYYIATKLDAIASRGGLDYRCSHDFEDLIYVLNYCPDFRERYEHESDTQLKDFLKSRFSELLQRSNIHEEIENALPMGEENRVDIILSILALSK